MTFELIEVDPATGEEDQLIATGTFEQVSRHMTECIENQSEDYNSGTYGWTWYRVQPAA